MDPTSPLMSNNMLSMLTSGSGARKRPFSSVNSLLTAEISSGNSDDYSILSSFGMKDRDIFKSPHTNNSLLMNKQDNEPAENFKVPMSATGQSPYFQMNTSSNKKQAQELDTLEKFEAKEPKTPKFQVANNTAALEQQQNPLSNQIQEKSIPDTLKEDFEIKPRQLRPIGEFTVSSLDKEYQELMQYLKDEREKDQQLFVKCSRSLRDRTESIIESLETLIKNRYQTLDENLHSVISEFEKEWETGKNLEEEIMSLKTQMSAIMTNILQSPGMQ